MKDGTVLTANKYCFKCGLLKPLSDFYVHKETLDGHLGKCKDCAKADVAAHRKANIGKIRAYDRKRAKTPARKKKLRENSVSFRKKNPVKYHAHSLVSSAVKCGRLVKPKKCEACGKERKLHGHHKDYYKPLDVDWLCVPCHHKEHKEISNGKKFNRH